MEKCTIVRTHTVSFQGLKVLLVNVEIQMLSGEPGIHIVGLPDKTIGESKERIRAALASIGLNILAKRFIINLSPADVKKEGSHYDLPIAMGLMVYLGVIHQGDISDKIVIGELGLNGDIRRINGVLIAALEAQRKNLNLICPMVNGSEAALISEIDVMAPSSLSSFLSHIKGVQLLLKPKANNKITNLKVPKIDMADIKGQTLGKRALEIAAAGRHNLLFCGPPGAGKSLLASQIPFLLPSMNINESLETTMIYSISGLLPVGELITDRPYRNPHHSASLVSLVGGGANARPGEISLANNGVLFLDELPEFPKSVLEALRQPLENRNILVSRARYHHTYPADIQLIAAMNPCPCGYFGIAGKECKRVVRCAEDYQKKISGPIFDRIDIYAELENLSIKEISSEKKGESSADVKKRITQAWKIQNERYKSNLVNSNAPDSMFQENVNLSNQGKAFLYKAAEKLYFSARGYMRILRVARTIADLERSKEVKAIHISEVLSFRRAKIT